MYHAKSEAENEMLEMLQQPSNTNMPVRYFQAKKRKTPLTSECDKTIFLVAIATALG